MSMEGLWQDCLSDHSQCCDRRFLKKDSKYTDFERKWRMEALWMEIRLKPPWVKADLAAVTKRRAQSGDGSNVDMQPGSVRQEHNRAAGLNEAQMFVGHQSCNPGRTLTVVTTSRRSTEGVNKITSGCRDVRTLCKQGRLKEALQIMDEQGLHADSNTYFCLLQGCINNYALAEGKQVHAHIMKSKLKRNLFVVNAIVNMYAKCGSMVDAQRLFDDMSQRDIFTWTMMMAGYAKHGHAKEALKLYEHMQWEGIIPNKVTFICVLNACASLLALDRCKQVHADIKNAGIVSYINLENTLIDTYAKCGSIEDARKVFDNMAKQDVVSCSAMISGYVQHGHGAEALKIYEQMQLGGTTPNRVTFIGVLNACASLGGLERIEQIHADIIESGIFLDIKLENTLIDAYAKCGSMEDACQVFNKMAKRDVVSWSVMIAGYVQHGRGWEAFEIYKKMQWEGEMPNRVTFIGVLNACATIGALERSKQVHADIIKAGIESYINLENTLVDTYSKCGSITDAQQVFDKMAERDVVSWNAIIAAYAQHGCGREALGLFERMQQEGFKADGITFTSVLSACSHVGLVDEGLHYFDSLSGYHGLTPTVEHFGCMVDLLGRAGQLNEAEDCISKMPIKPDSLVWAALLSAGRTHGDLEVAEHAAKGILECDPQHPASYVLLANIYAAAGRWDDRAKVRKMMEDRGVRKEAGRSWIEVNNQMHTFVVEDKLHPQIEEIHAELSRLSGQLKEAGYVPDMRFVLYDVEEEQKELSICYHSEKLAIAFALISTPPRMPIHVIKNLGVCGDCHTATKFISKIVSREIVLSRFHHFRDGICSCGDYL